MKAAVDLDGSLYVAGVASVRRTAITLAEVETSSTPTKRVVPDVGVAISLLEVAWCRLLLLLIFGADAPAAVCMADAARMVVHVKEYPDQDEDDDADDDIADLVRLQRLRLRFLVLGSVAGRWCANFVELRTAAQKSAVLVCHGCSSLRHTTWCDLRIQIVSRRETRRRPLCAVQYSSTSGWPRNGSAMKFASSGQCTKKITKQTFSFIVHTYKAEN